MNLEDLKKPLGIEDIDFRIQSINKGGYATILAYKDARVDMNRLDLVCGQANWQRDHKEVKGVVYCGIGIEVNEDVNNNLWVWKWDAGTEGQTEKDKAAASDSFKRSAFNWGIGRELYDYPMIKVLLRADEFEIKDGRAKQKWSLNLRNWTWFSQFTDGKLNYLACKDEREKARFEFGTYKK